MSDDDRRVGPCGKHCAVVDECEARGDVIRALRAENARLREALKPFADCEVWEGYKGYQRFVAGMFHIYSKGMDSLNISDLRAARAALKETGNE